MPSASAKTILVIDDDPDLLDLVAFVLEGEGYEVVTARDGREGLQALERRLPDLVLLDMKMPVLDGWEFARELHARYDHRVPIVVVTADDDARKRAEEVGAVGWVGKPFSIDNLAAAVRHSYVGHSLWISLCSAWLWASRPASSCRDVGRVQACARLVAKETVADSGQ